ncbi:hypothetical protein N7481_002964 [Penicillium waksmanii]|uniref:uncharacterized protein n=1 Tax=Penicillium waksmanii TaxID=69791 RepID=UPI002547F4A3|nr:uncharacterized protein N7481_002964 [Penicillium waksmanii]KAJ5987754.1 hypothetical protein N7481_002964 [Penicillium waksmanii]
MLASESLQSISCPGASRHASLNARPPQYTSVADSQHDSPIGHQDMSEYHLEAQSLGPTNYAETPHSVQASDKPHEGSTTYIGRSHYLSQDTPIDETSSRAYPPYQPEDSSGIGDSVLTMFNAFDLPVKSIRQALIDSFMRFCYPWTPILAHGELDFSSEDNSSLLLSQSLFLAASRASSSPGILAFATPAQFYQRAKALFFMNHETNPLTVIKATIMLQWYTPDGPEHVSYDAGEFWLKIGVGIAHQVGLHRDPGVGNDASVRRRVWWSLMVRDALMSVAHGRPRAINPEDVNVRPLLKSDFEDSSADGAELFIHYASICCILGDLTESCSRSALSQAKKDHFRSLLFRWPRTLPPSLQISYQKPDTDDYLLSAYNLNTRQLHIPYFIGLAIVGRPSTKGTVSAQSILAASFVAGIFDELLARDDIGHLAPIYNRYCVAASFFLISLRPFPELWEACQTDLRILRLSLIELSKRWKSAIGGSKALESILTSQKHNAVSFAVETSWLTPDQQFYFDGYSLELCHMWKPYSRFCDKVALVQGASLPLAPYSVNQDLLIPPHFNLAEDDSTVPFTHLAETGLPDLLSSDFLCEGLESWLRGG